MNILIVEDNHPQVELMDEVVKGRYPDAVIQRCNTEYEFRSALDSVAANPPDVVLMDVMLKWTDPSPDMVPAPPEIAKAGHRRAGLRCQKLLQENPNTRHVPVIFYTSLAASSLSEELKDMPPEARYLAKDSDPEPLYREIQRSLKKK